MRVIVSGASSLVARYLVPRLQAAAIEVIAVSRRSHPPEWFPESAACQWQCMDLAGSGSGAPPLLPAADALLALTPLWLLPPLLAAQPAGSQQRVLAFGSTSVLAKAASSDAAERALAQRLAAAEAAAAVAAARQGCALTLLRPTLIYDGQHDRNITRLVEVMRRFHCLPLVGEGRGLRQPVHADDLAAAVLALLQQGVGAGQTYTLTGGETLTYRAMLERLRQHYQLHAWLLPVPRPLVGAAVGLARLLPRYRDLNREMLLRMERDLVFDDQAARRDFAYRPRNFLAAPD